MDGLKGFPEAINSVYPQTHIQLCIIHMVRNSLRFVSWKDYKAVTRDLKAIYQTPTEEAGQQALEAFAAAWDSRYPQISRSWQANWPNLATFFAYPTDIRKAIYTTNAIESLNSVIRQAIKKRSVTALATTFNTAAVTQNYLQGLNWLSQVISSTLYLFLEGSSILFIYRNTSI